MLVFIAIMLWLMAGVASATAISYIRKFDNDRLLFGAALRRREVAYYRVYNDRNRWEDAPNFKQNMDDFEKGMLHLCTVAIGPLAAFPVLYHLIHVEWSKEQRQLIKSLNKDHQDISVEKLRDKLEDRRKKHLEELESRALQ